MLINRRFIKVSVGNSLRVFHRDAILIALRYMEFLSHSILYGPIKNPEEPEMYLKSGFKALKCAGYHPSQNKESDLEKKYKRAKGKVLRS